MHKLLLSLSGFLLLAIISPLVLKAQEYDIIISEIYADPTPSLGLPDAEYVELYNRSPAAINLINWAFADRTSTKAIETDFELMPNAYVILTKESNIDLFTTYGDVIGFSSFPSLNNSDDDLKLINPSGNIVHQVNYKSAWHKADKKDGGWSLEIIDPDNNCEEANNWSSSTNQFGGTPGNINSVDAINADATPPSIKEITIINTTQIEVIFSEALDEAEIVEPGKYTLASDVTTYQILKINTCISSNANCILIELSEELKGGIDLTASNLFDCAGNEISNQPFTFLITEKLIEIQNPTISPDNDGFEDELNISYKTEAPGYTGNIQIFDQRGRFVAHPVKNSLLAESGTITWDGLSETGERLPLGIYIVYAEFFDLNGNLQKQKLPIVIAGKF